MPTKVETSLASLIGSWDLSFEPNRGAPKLTLDQLTSWRQPDAGVKYFSGHGTYTKTIQAPASWFKPGAQLWLDLGDVQNLAEVTINGKPIGTLWKSPYRIDVSKALKTGTNKVEVKVANLWVNRLIGDLQPNATQKYTFTARNPYKPNSPLLPAGLVRPP